MLPIRTNFKVIFSPSKHPAPLGRKQDQGRRVENVRGPALSAEPCKVMDRGSFERVGRTVSLLSHASLAARSKVRTA